MSFRLLRHFDLNKIWPYSAFGKQYVPDSVLNDPASDNPYSDTHVAGTALAASKRCTHEIMKYTWIWQKSLLEWGPYFAIVQSKTVQILWNHCKHGKSVYLNSKPGLFLKLQIRTVYSGTLNPVLFWHLEGESTFILEYLKKWLLRYFQSAPFFS